MLTTDRRNNHHLQFPTATQTRLDPPVESDDGEGEWEDSVSSSRGSSHSRSGQGGGSWDIDEEEGGGPSTSLFESKSSFASVAKEGLQDLGVNMGRTGIASMGLQLGHGQHELQLQPPLWQQQQQQAGRSFKGCTMCRKSKVKCGEEKPGCGRCTRRGLECKYIQKAPQPTGRVRRHHQRSTAGCSTCRSRRVKCDEVGPICGPCSKRGCPCGFSSTEAGLPGSSEKDKSAKARNKISKRPALRPTPSYPPFTSRTELRSSSVGLAPRLTTPAMVTMTGRIPVVPLPLIPLAPIMEIPQLTPDELNKSTGVLLTVPDLGPAGFPLLPDGCIRGCEPTLPTPPLTGYPQAYNPLDMSLSSWSYTHPLTTQSAPTTVSSPFTTPQEDEDRSYFSGSGCLMGGDEPIVQGWTGGTGEGEVNYLAGIDVQVDPMGLSYPGTLPGPSSSAQHRRTGSRVDNYSYLHPNMAYSAGQSRLANHLIVEPRYRDEYAEAVHPRNTVPAYPPYIRSSEYTEVAPPMNLFSERTGLPQEPEPHSIVNYVNDIRLLPTPDERIPTNHLDDRLLPMNPSVMTVETQSRVVSKRRREEEHGQVIIREQPGPLGRWEPDGHGRLQPVVVTSKSDSYAVIPPPALPFTIIPPAFAELLELCPKSVMGMPTDFMMPGLSQEVTLTKEIDPLSTFFPLIRDRVIYRHFISQTGRTMIAMDDHDHLNPWTRHFAKLALGVPPGVSTAQDAFRSALLSLSAYDLGYRITMATGMTRADVHRNPIVKLSQEFWDETKPLLDCIVDEIQTPFSLSVNDLSLAACIALSHRDRLSASGQWLYSLEYAAEMINTSGGAGTFLSLSPTLIRRFLLEQMVCIDVFGSFFTIDAPLIFEPRSAWWESPFSPNSPRSLTEHIEIVFGVDRPMIDYLSRVMTVTAIGRHGAMKKQDIPTIRMARVSDQEVEDGFANFARDKKALLAEAEQIAIETVSRPYPARIAAGRIAWKNCVVVWFNIDAQNSKAQTEAMRQGVKQVFETVIESLGRGMVTHLCLPFCFAAYNARDEDRETVERILDMLEPYGRMDWTTLNRCIRFVWDCLDAPQSSVMLKNWRQLYDDEGLFLSYI